MVRSKGMYSVWIVYKKTSVHNLSTIVGMHLASGCLSYK